MAVYLVRASESDCYKIGHAVNVRNRVRELQTGCPHDLELVAFWRGGRGVEKRLHRRYEDQHRRGEWYEFSSEEVVNLCVEMAKTSPISVDQDVGSGKSDKALGPRIIDRVFDELTDRFEAPEEVKTVVPSPDLFTIAQEEADELLTSVNQVWPHLHPELGTTRLGEFSYHTHSYPCRGLKWAGRNVRGTYREW